MQVARIYNKLNTVPEHRMHSILYRSRTVFQMFYSSRTVNGAACTSVDVTVYQYGKNVLYLFYNIAQRNIKKEIFRRFRVDIELYQHGS